MRTPGHAVVNLAVLAGIVAPAAGAAIVAGAVLPDLPIFVLWTVERLRGRESETIWRCCYPRRPWIDLIHGTHSVPLAALGLGASAALSSMPGVGFFASALLHSALDFPLHADDAHRHFLPFSSWRFISPLSYWDPRYHARAVTLVETAVVAAAAAWLWTGAAVVGRGALLAVGLWYAASCVLIWAPARRALA